MQDTKLKIEILPGNALCKKVFIIIKNNKKCPDCTSEDWDLLSGREFMIKEIVGGNKYGK
jgi:hydrogenase nickel incorporation protein HypA/HybF